MPAILFDRRYQAGYSPGYLATNQNGTFYPQSPAVAFERVDLQNWRSVGGVGEGGSATGTVTYNASSWGVDGFEAFLVSPSSGGGGVQPPVQNQGTANVTIYYGSGNSNTNVTSNPQSVANIPSPQAWDDVNVSYESTYVNLSDTVQRGVSYSKTFSALPYSPQIGNININILG